MEHAYEKLMKEHNLSLNELPVDAKIGIESIQQIVKAINLAEKTNKNVKPVVYDKIKANDKWVVREILDYVENKNTNTDPLPNKAAEVIKTDIEPTAVKKEETPPPSGEVKKDEVVKTDDKPDDAKKSADEAKAGKIDAELKVLFEAGKTKLTLDEVKSAAKTAYGVIFDNYSAEGPNGVETTYYDLTETEKEVFTLTKK